MEWKRAEGIWITATVVGFYTTFILQNLWNWFVATAFNIPSVSYWQMYGVGLLIGLLFDRGTEFVEEQRWSMAFSVLDFCVPEEKMEALKEVVEQHREGIMLQARLSVVSRVMGNTATLALGWAVHLLLA